MESYSLDGKRALVGGSTAGIGRGCAIQLARNGAQVVLIARNEQKLQHTVKELPGTGHEYIVADFSSVDDVKVNVTEYLASNSGFEILVNNTGGPPGGMIKKAKADDFLNAFRMHLINNHHLTKLLTPNMIDQKYGRIINIISTSVRVPIEGLGVSNTTRGAVASWAKTMANELGDNNITVNNILPGFINTGRLQSIIHTRAEKAGQTEEEIAFGMKRMVPLGRFGDSIEIGRVCAFLASPAAGYISGTSIPVDGGRTKAL